MSVPPSRHRRLLLIGNIAAALLVLIGIAAVPKGDRVLVLVGPWSDPQHVVAVVRAAGGTLVATGRRPWIAVADGAAPDFVSRLVSAGAVLVLDGGFGAACLTRVFDR
ncbi:hypothetical protein [Aurantimonas sp. HBX-1]|uniref:hypothetical protein n=1 Tax=Aurantimonas sp. HBX-1 TaxID=2906072 RepID=UPI001F3624FF|nr:hypothetical protein [Aurantimonas sp. HBX-1]UIJ73122.1 hypothetical protein LXB15_05605 [Aurantimonas sp. HBX-1]